MTKKYDYSKAIDAFFIESREMLEDMENALLDIEKNLSDTDSISAVFRAAHTIKGSAGMFGFNDISDFTHIIENLLDDIRNGKAEMSHETITVLLECHDFIVKLLDYFNADRGAGTSPELKNESADLVKKLSVFLTGERQIHSQDSAESLHNEGANDREEKAGDIQVMNECWHISIRLGQNVFINGLDPQSFITFLGKTGKVIKIKCVTDSVPDPGVFDAEKCFLGFEINLMAYTSKEKIEEIFEFLRDDCLLRILSPGSSLKEYVRLINELPEEPMHIGEILMEIGSLTKNELEEALRLQTAEADSKKKKRIGEIFVDEKMVHQPVVDAALNKQNNNKKRMQNSMRVDTDKLDILINLVGELVTSASNMQRLVQETGSSVLNESYLQMARLINSIRENSMNIRMVQIGDTFKRFERVIRDLSREKGKQIEFSFSGAETELDKTIVEKVTDPLMHLVRNAIDHGIDTPEERTTKGKPASGQIKFNASHESGNIVIEISDDGNGLNKEKIIRKALEMNLVKEDQLNTISDQDISQLIFIPGFSTSEKVTDISGRGVGMDVVKKNIESLRGSVSVKSKKGSGTNVRITLPLTLAIIDGFLIKAGDVYCIFPLHYVLECTNSEEFSFVNDTDKFINFRGEIIPYVRITDFFSAGQTERACENIVIISHSNQKIGFFVDRIYGGFQTVIKPLGKIFRQLDWISGCTILGGGEIGLILDIPVLFKYLYAEKIKKAS